MKTLSLLSLAAYLLLSCSLFAQNPDLIWAKQVGGTNYVQSTSIATDAEGNILSTGFFLGTVDFDPSDDVFELSSFGGGNTFILKLTSEGDFIWAKQLESVDYQYATSIASDTEGNCYTVGAFNYQIDFDPGEGVQLFNTGSPAVNGYILKLDTDGNFVWAKQLEGAGSTSVSSIAIDSNNQIYTTGYFDDSMLFNPGENELTFNSSGSFDAFVYKLDVDGNFVWAKQMGGSEIDLGSAITTDTNGNVITTGKFRDVVDFDTGTDTFNLTAGFESSAFVQKLDSDGNFLWAKNMGTIYFEYARVICVDENGNIFGTGGFIGTNDFDPGEGVFNLTSTNNFDAVVYKLDGNGDFVWAKQLDGEGVIAGNGVVCDADNNLYAIGIFDSTIDVDPGDANVTLSSTGQTDSYIVKLNPDGEFTWVSQIGGPFNQLGYSLASDNNDHVYSVGNFAGTVDFDPSENTFNLTASEDFEDLFIQKLTAEVATDIHEKTIDSNVSLYPNPFNEAISIVGKAVLGRIQVRNLFGQLVLDVQTPDYSFNIPTEQWSNGVYMVIVGGQTMKMVK